MNGHMNKSNYLYSTFYFSHIDNYMMDEDLLKAKNLVLKKSTNSNCLESPVKGYKWHEGYDYSKLLDTYLNTGFQATNFGKAVIEIKKMIECRKQNLENKEEISFPEFIDDPFMKIRNNCTIFLGYTSNIVSCGLRETIQFLVQHNMVDCIVNTAGGIEEDLIKCFGDTYVHSYLKDDVQLRCEGLNRIHNLFLPNDNYIKFEKWIMPILDEMLYDQNEKGILWSPSRMIAKLGSYIDNEDSIYYWAAKNKIPVFCPALTDGSIGDMLFFHSANKNKPLILDIVSDVRRINMLALKSFNTGLIIIGDGLVKHHILNSNCMRNGGNFAVYLNTANEFDGSDSGAPPSEAVTWGKINPQTEAVKIHAEASLVFPLLVGKTFAEDFYKSKQ